MWRLIGLFLLIFAPLTTMAQTDYPIHDDFRVACRITAPLGRGVLGIGNAFLAAMPKGMRSDRELTINKIKITSTADNKEFGVWVITPKGTSTPRPAILFLHGGGFVFKGAPYHYDLAKEYARRTGSVVVMVDYRTAHNNPYGTSLNDCVDAWRWLIAKAQTLGIDTARTAIVGDSAGGFLAIKTVLASDVRPSKLMLIYPVVDCSMRTESMAKFGDTPVWNSELNRKMWEYYLQGSTEISLLDLTENELQNMPTTYVETAEFDCLRDEGNEFARLLQSAGVATTHAQISGTMHGFDMAQRSDITQRQITERCKWLVEW
ncbi:MAG: alpha/beta hydrolase [Rikenellaceae bacterium]|nr:alpha/beta hydrolase [Rikenellaceae bacterium]